MKPAGWAVVDNASILSNTNLEPNLSCRRWIRDVSCCGGCGRAHSRARVCIGHCASRLAGRCPFWLSIARQGNLGRTEPPEERSLQPSDTSIGVSKSQIARVLRWPDAILAILLAGLAHRLVPTSLDFAGLAPRTGKAVPPGSTAGLSRTRSRGNGHLDFGGGTGTRIQRHCGLPSRI